MLTFNDILFGVTTIASCILSILSLMYLYGQGRKRGVNDLGSPTKSTISNYSSLVLRVQKQMLFGVLLFHVLDLSTYYVDILHSEGTGVDAWDGENLKGWFLWFACLGTNLVMVNASSWLLLIQSKLIESDVNRSRVIYLNSTDWLTKFNAGLNGIVMIGTIVIPFLVFMNDGGRGIIWSSMIVCAIMTFFFLVTFSVLVTLTRSYLGIRQKNGISVEGDQQRETIRGLKRMILFSFIIVIVCPIAILSIIRSNILKYPLDRITNDYTRSIVCEKAIAIYGDCKYRSTHVTFTLLMYSLTGALLSLPFVPRKDFSQVLGLYYYSKSTSIPIPPSTVNLAIGQSQNSQNSQNSQSFQKQREFSLNSNL